MKALDPPRLANWLLRHFASRYCRESLLGDLREEYELRQSPSWYWREVMAAVAIGTIRALHAQVVLLRSVLASWAVLTICLWSVDSLERIWMRSLPNQPEGVVHACLRWNAWLLLLISAHGAAGGVLGQVPRRHRIVGVTALSLALLDWRLPVVGRLMRHLLDTRADAWREALNFAEFAGAILGLWFGMLVALRRNGTQILH